MTWHIPLGPFELREPIGQGGMGEVWYGIHVPQQVPVAVKVMRGKGLQNPEYVEAFHNEVRAVAALDHPGIIIPLDYGEVPVGTATASSGKIEAGSPFIVMEHAKRGSLKRFKQVIGWKETKMVLFTILDALAHAHAAGVIHRDLKPANILVGCSNETPGIKLTDFGLARVADSFEREGTTETGWGTPAYMAPEQFRGRWRDYGPWTDLYALGVMAFELTSGFQPFQADSKIGFARAHALKPPKEHEPSFPVPDGFQAWLHRLLQKDPRDRFQRAADAAWALQVLGDPAPVGGRSTVTLMPISTADHEARLPTVSTAQNQAISENPDPDPTEMERPGTTELFGDDDIIDFKTASLRLEEWGDEIVDEVEFEHGELAPRAVPPLPYTWERPRRAPPSMKLLGAGLGLFGLRQIRMVGRDAERDVIWKHLKEARQSQKPHGVILRGGAGTGKTRLAQWIMRRAHEVGSAEVFSATHSPTGGPADGLSRMMARQMRCIGLTREETYERMRHLLTDLGMDSELDWLAFTELLNPLEEGETIGSEALSMQFQKSEQRFALVRRYLSAVAKSRPVVLLLDDIQWGSETLSFVLYMMDRAEHGLPLLFIMTAREEALQERPVEEAMVDHLTKFGGFQTQLVGRLADDETHELVRELLYLNDKLAEEVEARCGGNPLFAAQLVGTLISDEKIQFGSEGFELRPRVKLEIPDDIHSLWLRRLNNLTNMDSEHTMASLELAAALGNEVALSEWEPACRAQGIQLPGALLNQLIDSGLASPTEDGWAFCHGMLRESLERNARENGRWVAHNNACIDMLRTKHKVDAYPHCERLANHFIEAHRHEEASKPLSASIEGRLRLSDYEDAWRHVDRLDWLAEHVEKTDYLNTLANVFRSRIRVQQGQLDEARRYSQKAAIAGRKNGWADVIPVALCVEGQAELAQGQLTEAQRTFERAQSSFERLGDLDGVADATLGLARVQQFHGDLADASDTLESAAKLFEQGRNLLGVAKTMNAAGDVARAGGNLEEAREFTNRAMSIFREVGNQAGVADCINDLAELSRMQGDLEGALNSCHEAMGIYRSLGSELEMVVRQNLGLILLHYSRYRESRNVFTELAEHFEATGQHGVQAAANVYLLPSLAAMADWDEWKQRIAVAESLLNQTGYWEPEFVRALTLASTTARKAGLDDLADRAVSLINERVEAT